MTKPATKQLNLLGMVEIPADEFGQAVVDDFIKGAFLALKKAVEEAGGTFTAGFNGEAPAGGRLPKGSRNKAADAVEAGVPSLAATLAAAGNSDQGE